MSFRELIESVPYDRALNITTHTPQSLMEIFNNQYEEYDQESKMGRPKNNQQLQPYILAIKRCREIVKNNGKNKATYKIGKNKRNFASNSVQSLKKDIRGYLLHEYLDFDMVNFLPTTLLYLAKENNIDTPLLSYYVNNREKFFKYYSTNKQNINIIINSLEPKRIPQKLKPFREEIESIGSQYGGINNMIAKSYDIETNILYDIYDNLIQFEIAEKDGFYLHQKTLEKKGYEINDFVKILDLQTLKYGIKWKNKELEGKENIVPKIDIEPQDSKDYDLVKEWLDEQLFLTISPATLWYKTIDEEGVTKFNQIKNQEANLIFRPYTYLDEKEIERCIIPKWLSDKNRKTYQGIVFKPYGIKGKDPTKKNYYNTFNGFDIWNKYGEHEEFINNWKSKNHDKFINCFLRYLRHLTGNEEVKTNYVINWIAFLFQFPEIRPDIILIFKGEQGAGKDTLVLLISMIIGEAHSYDTENISRILGNFNADIDGKIFTAINELSASDGYKYSSAFKAGVTNKKNTINQKNEKTFRQNNVNHFIVLSNQEKPAHVESTDRRSFVCNTGKELLNNRKYWTEFYNYMKDDEFILTIYKFFMTQDLTNFNIRDRPITKEFNVMKAQNIPVIYSFLKREGERLLDLKIDDEKTWKFHKPSNCWICLKKDFKNSYNSYISCLPYYEALSEQERKKWKHFEEEGHIARIQDTGFCKKKIKKLNINCEAWIFEPQKLLAYFKQVNMFPEVEEDIIELEDEFLDLLLEENSSEDEE